MQRDTRDVHTHIETKSHRRTLRKEPSASQGERNRLCGHLGLGPSASRDVRSKCLLFKQHSSWSFVMALLGNECTKDARC